MLRQLGQDLFAPPNVKGWDGGITWITTNTLLTRYNDAQSLVEGAMPPLSAADLAKKPGGAGGKKVVKALQRVRMGGVNVEKILTPEERDDNHTIIASLQHRLFQTTLQQRPAGGVAGISRFQNQNVRRGHRHRHPADDVHAGIPSHMRQL